MSYRVNVDEGIVVDNFRGKKNKEVLRKKSKARACFLGQKWKGENKQALREEGEQALTEC